MVTNAPKSYGAIMEGYVQALIHVVPGPLTSLSVQVYTWCDVLEKFVATNPATTKTGMGLGIPYAFNFAARGQTIFVALTGTVNDACNIYVAGATLEPDILT
jgi:hypothetical protein